MRNYLIILFKENLAAQMEHKCTEITKLQAECKKQQTDLDKAEQVNSDLRGKTLDKELEAESLQVIAAVIGLTGDIHRATPCQTYSDLKSKTLQPNPHSKIWKNIFDKRFGGRGRLDSYFKVKVANKGMCY